ncbi:lytic transglycosylase domain-containing protein [bacterium]|nr:lytic transglycosylase domain-containing protein [bacterium]
MTLQRINAIERQFASLMYVPVQNNNESKKTEEDFKEVLDKNVKNVKNVKTEPVPTEKIESLIEEYSEKNKLDKDLVKSVVRHESGFNVNATSKCGAMGLMQLMPATAEGLGVINAYDAEQNIAGGTKYLKGLMDRFDNNKELALAAYNAGPNAVKKYGGIPPYKETQNYVKCIMKTYDNYKGGN